jgi:hypothetical protein
MNIRFRNFLAVLGGLTASIIVMMLMESIPVGPEMPAEVAQDPALLRAFMLSLPAYLYGWIALGYALGSLIGGMVAHWIGKGNNKNIVRLSAALITLGILNMLMIPQPWWFWGHLLVYFPFAFLGQQWAKKWSRSNQNMGFKER